MMGTNETGSRRLPEPAWPCRRELPPLAWEAIRSPTKNDLAAILAGHINNIVRVALKLDSTDEYDSYFVENAMAVQEKNAVLLRELGPLDDAEIKRHREVFIAQVQNTLGAADAEQVSFSMEVMDRSCQIDARVRANPRLRDRLNDDVSRTAWNGYVNWVWAYWTIGLMTAEPELVTEEIHDHVFEQVVLGALTAYSVIRNIEWDDMNPTDDEMTAATARYRQLVDLGEISEEVDADAVQAET